MKQLVLACLAALSLAPELSMAQMRMPGFAGGIPGVMQFQAILSQRAQARALLYQEAIKELKANPRAADLPSCSDTAARNASCIDDGKPALSDKAAQPVAERNLALLIGNNHYKTPIPELETPLADVNAIGKILREKFAYETTILPNASKEEIVGALQKLASSGSKFDSAIVFYAGHGYLLEDIKMGFWIPTDANNKSAKGWISNSDISRLLKSIPARQIMLISDSCFSGSLTNEYKYKPDSKIAASGTTVDRTVVAFTSGGDEPVSDEGKDGHSIFAWGVINTLNKQSGSALAGYELFRKVQTIVTKEFPQAPQYGAILSAGHIEGGEYLILPPETKH